MVQRAEQLGRYHLLDRIAYGGMAEIFRAKTFDRNGHEYLVAVKRVLPHLAEDKAFIRMLVDEARITANLKHKNIAQVYEFAKAKTEYFIAMEHVDGKDLRSILSRLRETDTLMSLEHALHISAETAAGLHAAHSAKDSRGRALHIIHRDVSPSNILCAYTGQVKLCDFGIAKAKSNQSHTKTGVIKGKIKYMSPEQALGRTLDHRTDIFSLGACIYEMIARVPPFIAETEMDLLLMVRDAEYVPLSRRVPDVPKEVESIVDRCLVKTRAHRYQNCAEVERDLRSFLDKYFSNYLRSHFGRFIRKLFAKEIEEELMKLTQYSVDGIEEDVGENLIANNKRSQEISELFTPRPTGVTGEQFVQRDPAQRRSSSPKPGFHDADTQILERTIRAGRNRQ